MHGVGELVQEPPTSRVFDEYLLTTKGDSKASWLMIPFC